MSKSPPWKRRYWRGVPLGGALMRGCKFAFTAHDGQATTAQIASYCRPEIIHAGGKPTRWQLHSHAKAARALGAKKLRRIGTQWLWRLNEPWTAISGRVIPA